MNADALQENPYPSSRVHCPKRPELICICVCTYALCMCVCVALRMCMEVVKVIIRMHACLLGLGTSDICIPISSIIIDISGVVNLMPDLGMPVHWRVLKLMPATKQ